MTQQTSTRIFKAAPGVQVLCIYLVVTMLLIAATIFFNAGDPWLYSDPITPTFLGP